MPLSYLCKKKTSAPTSRDLHRKRRTHKTRTTYRSRRLHGREKRVTRNTPNSEEHQSTITNRAHQEEMGAPSFRRYKSTAQGPPPPLSTRAQQQLYFFVPKPVCFFFISSVYLFVIAPSSCSSPRPPPARSPAPRAAPATAIPGPHFQTSC